LQLGIGDRPVLVYSGSLGGKYLLDEMLLFFQTFKRRRSDAIFLVLTPDTAIASAALARSDFAEIRGDCRVLTASPDEVASYIGIAEAGLAPISPTMSMMAAAPIKTAEYLLTGVPVVGTEAVGDNAALMDAGIFRPVDFCSAESRSEGVSWIADVVIADRDGFRHRARAGGIDSFSIDRSVEQYRAALTSFDLSR
jgi:hypothetical protein